MTEYGRKCIAPGGVCDCGQWVGEALSPRSPAVPLGALALHRAIGSVGIPRPGSVWDLAPLLAAALCLVLLAGGHSHLGTLLGLDMPVTRQLCPLGSQRYQFCLCQGAPACGQRAELPAWAGIAQPVRVARLGWEQPSRAGAGAVLAAGAPLLSPPGTSRTSGRGAVPGLSVAWAVRRLCHCDRRGRARLQCTPGSAAAAPSLGQPRAAPAARRWVPGDGPPGR